MVALIEEEDGEKNEREGDCFSGGGGRVGGREEREERTIRRERERKKEDKEKERKEERGQREREGGMREIDIEKRKYENETEGS